MKGFLILSIFSLAGVAMSGCAPAAQPESEAATPAPVAPWQVVGNVSFDHSVYYAGFLDESFGITVGYGGEVHYTADGGATWPQAQNTSWCRFGLEIVDSEVAWHCGNGGDVRLSTDGGRTWQEVADFGPNEPNQCRHLSFLSAATGWAATPFLLAGTTDSGTTWQEIALPQGADEIAAIALRTPTDGALLDSGGMLHLTADGGESWSSQPLEFAQDAFLMRMPSPLAVMRFMDEKRAMIVLARGSAEDGFFLWSAYTTDGGQSWQLDQLPLPAGIPSLFLSRDGMVLTVRYGSNEELTVLRFQQP